MARSFYRYEKIDDIINANNALFDRQARNAIFASSSGGYSAKDKIDIDKFIDDATAYFISMQSNTEASESYQDLIDETLLIKRFTAIDNASEESHQRISRFVQDMWHLLGLYASMKSGDVHQIWMATQSEKERVREAAAIADVSRTYAVYDFPKWMSMDMWTIVEAAALSMGIEPQFAIDLPSNFDETTETDFRKAFEARKETVERALRSKAFKNDVIVPKDFQRWAQKKRLGFDVPTLDTNSDEIHTNTKHKFYRILLSVAFRRYGLRPQVGIKYKVIGEVSQIEDDCKFCGFPVDTKTIQKYLDQALEWAKISHNEIIIKLSDSKQ
ncbi:hypothetical protein [Methylobacterium sp. J-070]|uniref:hypothetical protein n=1 Tax=Methylobacterium sp. J-070 TaxID=2836650 RepID=UPI001FBAB495|nr:hypothetical protein [Methylobacterium sp. J-070]MCJ2048777.1 hypothetical protein [Methylobacterium sp. J-070]